MSLHKKGVAALAAVTVLWVSTSELIQLVEDEGYNKPLFVTLCSLSCLSIFNLKSFMSNKRRRKAVEVAGQYRVPIILFAIGWLLANICFNASLEMTTVASTTTLSSTSSAFTLFMGWIFGTEVATKRKILAACVSMLGVLFIALSDNAISNDAGFTISVHNNENNNNSISIDGTTDAAGFDLHAYSLAGDLIAFLGAFLYAGYLTVFQKQVADKVDTEVFLGLVGLVGIAMLPLAALEGFVPPSTRHICIIVANGVVSTAIGNRLWLYGSVHCGPMAATLALSASIPVAGLVDLVRGKLAIRFEWVVGAICICAGFMLGTLNTNETSNTGGESGGGSGNMYGADGSGGSRMSDHVDDALNESLIHSDWGEDSDENEPVKTPLDVARRSPHGSGDGGRGMHSGGGSGIDMGMFSFKKRGSKE